MAKVLVPAKPLKPVVFGKPKPPGILATRVIDMGLLSKKTR